MDRNLRIVLPAVYAIAIVIAFLAGNTTVVLIVVVAGAMLLGLAYAMSRGGAPGVGRDRQRNRRP